MSKTIHTTYTPDTVSPPGETLLEMLEERGLSQVELAQRMGRPLKTINEIIKGKAAITPETALQLERVLGVSAGFWNRRERRYREYLAQEEEGARLASQSDWLKQVPLKPMIQLGWIREDKDAVEQAREALNFFGVATPETYLKTCIEGQLAYRKSKAFESHAAAIAAWLRRGEIEAREIDCQPYEERKFRALLPGLRALTRIQDPSVFVPELQQFCAKCGVAVVFVPELPGTRLCGAARWLTSEKALIQLSLRYKTDDHLWFTFFHEAAHILLHGKRAFFVDDAIGEGADEKEAEADKFASDLLIPPDTLRQFQAAGVYTLAAIQTFAEQIGIAPGIVVGRLQHDKNVDWNIGNGLKTRYVWAEK